MNERRLEVSFCPDNMAVIRPAPADRPARDMKVSVSLAKEDYWPDHVVFLMAKARPIVDWAFENLPMVAARRVAEYVRTRKIGILAPLTEFEWSRLREKNIELDARLNL